VYSEKGPWTEVENRINYKDPKPNSSDEDDDINEGFNFKMNMGGIGGMGGVKKLQATMASEEFKMVETDNDQIDLLGGDGMGDTGE
jgi:hypothetical protein